MLHIQMQLCDISLWDWIVDRNKRCGERTEESSSKIYSLFLQYKYLQGKKKKMYFDFLFGSQYVRFYTLLTAVNNMDFGY